ncbi:MAG TPA: phytoene desaturase family protein [Sporichthyaceae bacterium]|nr:phytoene desaturase family protein [Sporichthyaceae bacterium]
MRTVSGPSDRVVIVGAGLSGLSAALRLVGAGRQVTLLERESVPGGRAGVRRVDGYTFDTGPTVLTMPDLIADAFDCVGERMDDWLTLRRLDPAYRVRFADGTTLDVRATPEDTAAEIAALCGPAEAQRYQRLVDWLTRLYRYQMRSFIDRNLDSPLALVNADLARLVAAGGFGRLGPAIDARLTDPRLRRVFSFQSMYAGLAPTDALACYAVISYMDTVAGVWFPDGGLHALPTALAATAAKHGVDVRYDTDVVSVERSNGRAVAVRTAAGDRVSCDAVVLTVDRPVAAERLLGQRSRRRLRYSPSCALLLAGAPAAGPHRAHHEVVFGTAWDQTFTEIIDRGELMSDESFLVSTASRTDASLAPAGRDAHTILFPTPNLTGHQDWARLRGPYRDRMLRVLTERGYPEFAEHAEVIDLVTPADWADRGMAAGTPFAAAHTFRQTGPFRPANLARGWDNVVFAGSGTVPGVGVPSVLISGRLAAERITGPDRTYRSRAWLS